MTVSYKTLFIQAALVGVSALPLGVLAQNAPHAPASPASAPASKMTVRDASILLRDANRATVDFATLGIINAISSPDKVTVGTSTMNVGLTKDLCLSAKDQQKHMVSLDTYKAAQAVMIEAGYLTPANAEKSYKAQVEYMNAITSISPRIGEVCNGFGITNVIPDMKQYQSREP